MDTTTEEMPTPKTPKDLREKASESVEHGGPKGPEPTRFGDWEQKGRCTDF